jgi:WD40 repeat protein
MIPPGNFWVRVVTGITSAAFINVILTASSSYDLFVKLWNVDDEYKNFATLRGHEHSISSVRFLPGDNRVASSSRDSTVRIWDIASMCALLFYC